MRLESRYLMDFPRDRFRAAVERVRIGTAKMQATASSSMRRSLALPIDWRAALRDFCPRKVTAPQRTFAVREIRHSVAGPPARGSLIPACNRPNSVVSDGGVLPPRTGDACDRFAQSLDGDNAAVRDGATRSLIAQSAQSDSPGMLRSRTVRSAIITRCNNGSEPVFMAASTQSSACCQGRDSKSAMASVAASMGP